MPPPESAELLEKTLLLTVNVPPALEMPTTTVAELSIKLLSVTVAVLKLLMPPPQPPTVIPLAEFLTIIMPDSAKLPVLPRHESCSLMP